MQPSRPIAHPPALDAHELSLFLDFDGTLVDLAERPDAVVVGDNLTALLSRLARRLSGRLALVSGRSIAQLDVLIGPDARNLATVGSHGAEIRAVGGSVAGGERPAGLQQAEAAFREAFAGRKGIIIEVKSLGVALHYRQDPSSEAAAHALAERLAAANALEVQKGKMMVELRAGGHDKGSAIAALMRGPPFEGHMPVFLGDDVTDEPGFERCAAMGGAGILVGPERPTAAAYRLASVAAAHDWLAAL
ncbi:MAG: trehalose-phosphatase [Sphingomicrobium sp.]